MTNITVCDKHKQIVTQKKNRKQKKFYGDIEALADARRALKNLDLVFSFMYLVLVDVMD